MITKMFSVFDSKAGNFSPPFFMVSIGQAVRSFQDIASDQSTMIARHPEDFSLFFIGEFDDAIGEVTMLKHQNLGVAASFKKPEISIPEVFTESDRKARESLRVEKNGDLVGGNV